MPRQETHTHRLNKRDTSIIDKPFLDTNYLSFYAHGRRFDLYLKKDTGPLTENVDIEFRYSKKPPLHVRNFFAPNFYTGFVDNEARSHVICYFETSDMVDQTSGEKEISTRQPLIYAQIHIMNEEKNSIYYVEPLVDKTSGEIKYLVYRSDDIDSEVIVNGNFKYYF